VSSKRSWRPLRDPTMRYSKLYRELWALSGNPFPDHAIAAAGDKSAPFYNDLYPGVEKRMARAFLGSSGAPPTVAFLWSLGEGDEARGYGKTRHLLWFADRVNTDFGRRAQTLAGRESNAAPLIATYAAFSSIEGLSLSNLLFDVVRDLIGARGAMLANARNAVIESGRTPAQVHAAAEHMLQASGERWSAPLLYLLCNGDPKEWIEYLDNRYVFSQWHRVRYGRELLRSALAFIRQLRIERLLVLVDQLEDFANRSTPSYKLRRDFPRLAYLCSIEPLFRRRLTFVLTMHPRAARALNPYWPDGALGPLRSDESASNVLVLGGMTIARFKELVTRYLDSVRPSESRSSLAPFTDSTIELVHEIDRGRPGYCLQRLHFLLDAAAREGCHSIDRLFAIRSVNDVADSMET
jgi:hypothetical protein